LQIKNLTVSFIVPVYNEERHIGGFLQSLIDQTLFESKEYDSNVILVDGNSSDKTFDIVQDFISNHDNVDLRILNNELKIVPISMNLGIMETNSDIIVRMDVHTLYPKCYAQTLINFLVKNKDSNVVNVGASIQTIPGDSSNIARVIASIMSNSLGIGSSFRSIKDRRGFSYVDTVPFGCFWRADLIKIGMFDEEMVRNQDDELNWRLKKSGGLIALIPIDNVLYFARTSIAKHSLMLFQYGFFKPLTFLKSRTISSFRSLAPLCFFLIILCVTMGAFFWPSMLLPAFVFWVSLIFLYLACGALILKQRSQMVNINMVILTGYILFITHFSYGLGFFLGILKCILPWLRLESFRDSR
jgi:glycosyltransferase involved in cell wall biosynthesis